MSRMKGQAGMTLVEIMIVVALIGLLAGIGIPSFKALVPRIKLRNACMVLSNEIAAARVRAISRSSDFIIVFDDANDRYEPRKLARIVSGACHPIDFGAGTLGWCAMGWTDLGGLDLQTPSGFVTAAITPSVPTGTLLVDGTGSANVTLGGQGIIELRTDDGDHRKRIKIEPSGRVLVERWTGSAWVED